MNAVAAGAPKPNIVIFYLDDTAPHDGRLWSDPDRTPAIYSTFVQHGIRFSNAYGAVPLCCPARGTVLSGLHAHNNGLTANDARLFSPTETVATELKDAGYTTMWIGKYLNHSDYLSPQGWTDHMAGWSVFEGLFGLSGAYYDYEMRTKDLGDIHYANVHSTQMVADRAVARLAAAPADKPVFAMLSIYNTHEPNIPMPVSAEEFAKCDDIAPYWTPNYNEADVSDKPPYIQAMPLLPDAAGFPLNGYCREMFGVDIAVQRVTDELEAQGRLENTLLIFTADNGMAWGAHRVPQRKNMPFTTALPLYMSWPARWGGTARTIDDYVSNLDLAPTFCAVAGCTMGPYPTGQSTADGLSLLNLIDDGTALGRDALLETSPLGDSRVPGWWAVRTTDQSPLGLWHYVEYSDGERELYDLEDDPYELENVHGDAGHTAVQAALELRLTQLRGEGRVNRPDLSLWGAKMRQLYAGYNYFDSALTPRQTLTFQVPKKNKTYWFQLKLNNNALASDDFTITASSNSTRIRATFSIKGVVVTSQMTSPSGLTLNDVPGATTTTLRLDVHVKRRFPVGTRATIDIYVSSTSTPSRDDHVALVVTR